MRILITIKGGSSSIEGEIRSAFLDKTSLDDIVDYLSRNPFIILEKTAHGDVIVSTSAIGYITRKQ